MVWSGGLATIRVPFDAVEGGGRNFVDIGEEIPEQVSASFTAGLVFRDGNFDPNDPTAMFPNGFAYWIFGISINGRMEIVAVYYTVSAPTDGEFTYFRQTVFSVSPPIGVDNPPIVSIGDNNTYATYSEGTAKVVAQGGIASHNDGSAVLAGLLWNPYPMLGMAPDPYTVPIVQAFPFIGASNSSGDALVTFPFAFPNGIASIIVVPGDIATTGCGQYPPGGFGGPTLSNFNVRIFPQNARSFRVNVIAVGW